MRSSWRERGNRSNGYPRRGNRGYRQNRGEGNSRQGSSENRSEDGGHRQDSGHRGGGGGYRGRPYKRFQATHSYDGKRPKYMVGERLKEEDTGITEFVGNHKRFSGLLKERFGDFHVHEISCDGEICKLTTQDIPPEPQELENMEKLKNSLPSDMREKLEAFANNSSAINSNKDSLTTEIDVTELSKELRRNIHIIAKKIPSVVSETIDRGEKKIIVLATKQKYSSHKFRSDHRVDWSARDGNYCHFLLHKVNMDTMDALNQLATKLRIKPDMFHYAGTKDRRARTTQWVSLKKISPHTIHDAARQVPGAHVGNFKFCKDSLNLGMLNGNRFRIALRSVNATDEEIEIAVTSLRDNGFINYYGLQRFGSIAAIPTHEIGKALLQGKWEQAIDLILKPRDGEQHRDMIEARKIYQKTKDAAAALRPIARSGKIEAKLLYGLTNSDKNNPQGALDYLPRNARLMYIHAYQSLVWNHMVSRRIREFGPKPIVGDLVYEKSDQKDVNESETMDYALQNDDEKEAKCAKTVPKAEEKKDVTNSQDEVPADGDGTDEKEKVSNERPEIPVDEVSEATAPKVMKVETETETLDDSKDLWNLPAVKVLTEDDLPNYTFADVLMPKPGWKVTYPSYAKPWFDEFLAKDDLTTDLRQKNKKYSLGGAYRTVLETPGDLTWRIARYNGYHDDLILGDIDQMRGMDPLKDDPEGKYKALILEFSLRSSAYATMALREILDHDTSAHTQAAQSAANQAQDSLERAKEKESNADSVADIADETAKPQDAILEKSANEETEKVDTGIKEGSSPEKITKETNGSEMEIVEDSANIPAIVDDQKMEVESTEISDIQDKIEDNV